MFEGCTALKSIDLPDSLTYLGQNTFTGSGLTSIVIPANVKYMGISRGYAPSDVTTGIQYGASVFANCADLVSVTLPEGFEAIGSYVFYNCTSLKSILLPDSLYSICKYAFTGSGLESVNISANLTDWDYAFQNCTYLETVTIAEGVTEIPAYAFQNCTSLPTINLPSTIEVIGSCSFDGCSSLSSIVLPDSLMEINGSVFANCTSLKSIIIPKGVMINSSGVFKGWTKDQTIYIMDSWYEISQFWYGPIGVTATVLWNDNCYAQIVYGYTPK